VGKQTTDTATSSVRRKW